MVKRKIGKMVKILVMGLAVAAFIAGCSLDGDSTVFGTATKGPIDSATVSVYVLNSDGTRGALLGSSSTDADGSYTLNVSYTGSVAVVITGGSYVDEATGDTVTLSGSDELVTLLDSVATSGLDVAVTALTTIAADQAIANAGSGIETAIAAANLAVATEFGISGMDITSVIPVDPTDSVALASATPASVAYGIVMAAMTQLAADNGVAAADVITLIKAMADDYSDGVMDGTNAAGNSTSSDAGLNTATAMSGWATAITNFLGGARNATGLSAMPSF